MTIPAWMAGATRKECGTIGTPATQRPHRRGVGIGLSLLMGVLPLALPHGTRAQDNAANAERVTVEGEIRRVPVFFHRADVETLWRARHLVTRLDRAALEACGDNNAIAEEMRRAIERSDCRRDAVMRAVKDVNAVTLDRAVARYGLPQ
ncbi:conserved hypothetical protein [Gluconacetobacter diazotrophicus PA1 5]|uniref:Uncharacterized protein n=2 Tax=Gluconacetobacter diazotrophicus TaxID=33996 RepID=A9HIT5_GLUDA|nr:UrcA family protein [Gluconacetobacter diazotrophicus]ACI49895.1 conserved hypothetical protein [Gluconacetobacter diazotrophicus PA1 5]MBB2156446.1 UrcA family protein [Gluconacetobacter diazotrophicus]TWB05939.1 UrcA family protein [Gluconacetobacter diazotrophicus]CAP55812.1 hypothetical protein GDI1869 [Gluconacetobacter diazotrophicus PA1 5]